MKKVMLALVVLLAIGAAVFWWLNRKSPEQEVKEHLEKLSKVVAKNGEEGPATIAVKMDRMQTALFTDPVEISGDAAMLVGHHSANELASIIARGRQIFGYIDLDFTDVEVTIQGNDKATANFTGVLTVTSKMDDAGKSQHFREITAYLRKVEDEWRFEKFEVVTVLEK